MPSHPLDSADSNDPIEKLMGKLGSYIEVKPLRVIAIILMLTALMLFPASTVNTDTDASGAFLPDDPIVDISNEVHEHFSIINPFILILTADDGDILSRNSIIAISKLTEDIKNLEGIEGNLDSNSLGGGVISPATMVELTLMQMGTNLTSSNETAFNDAIRMTFTEQNPAALTFLSSDLDLSQDTPSASRTLMIITPDPKKFEGVQTGPGGPLDDLDTTLFEYISLGGSEGLETQGIVGFAQEFERGALQGLSLIPIAIAIVAGVLLFTLRSLSDLLLALFCIPLMFIWMVGLTGLFSLTINTLSYFAPLLVLALGIDYAIVLLSRQKDSAAAGMKSGDQIRTTLTHAGAAVFLSMATTFIAFLSNAASPIGGLRDFGLFLAVGIFSAFIIMGILLPTLHYFFTKKSESNGATDLDAEFDSDIDDYADVKTIQMYHDSIFARIAKQAHSRPRVVIPVVLILIIIAANGATQLESSFTIQDFLSDDSPVLASFELMNDEFTSTGGGQSMTVLVKGDLATPEFLNATRNYLINMNDAKLIGVVPSDDPSLVVSAKSIYHHVIIFTSNKSAMENLTGAPYALDEYGLPISVAGVNAVYAELSENGYNTIYGNVSPEVIRGVLQSDGEGGYIRGLVIIDYTGEGSDQYLLLDSARENTSVYTDINLESGITGERLIFLALTDAIVETMSLSIIITIIMCLLVLMITLRSPSLALVTVGPILVVSLMLFGGMFYTGMSLNLLTVLIAAISIGVGVDFNIHITHRFREALDVGLNVEDAIDTAMATTGKALMAAGLSSFLGFCVLLFATLNMFRTFGLLAAMMTGLSISSAFLVLPLLLKWWANNSKYTSTGSTS